MMMSVYDLNRAECGTHNIISNEIGANKVVLDVGCNKGYLYDLAPDNIFYGIDFNEEDLAVAGSKYEKVYMVDLNRNYNEFKADIKFDVIVFADILEHLLSPLNVLKYFIVNFLKSGGKVILSLPNIAHFSVRLKLLLGKFDYMEDGILDRSHLHFYTLKTALEMAGGAQLNVERVEFSSNNFGSIIKKIPVLGPVLGYNLILSCKKY